MTKRLVFNGKENIWVEGVLLTFQPEVDLFRSGRKWWLAYKDASDRNTGHFKSKKKAIEWYTRGGR
jgi:hypothetical protein